MCLGNHMPYIQFESRIAKFGILKLLIDTGASISIIKSQSLKNKFKINKNEIIEINGVNKEVTNKTLGTTNITINDTTHKFHVICEQTNIPYDGILGHDYLKSSGSVIDFKNKLLTNPCTSMPLFYINRSTNELQILNPRSETLIEIHVLNPEIKEGIIPDITISDSVFLCKAITRVHSNSKAYATILNCSNYYQTITKPFIKLEPLSDKSFIFEISDKYSERVNKMEKCIRTSHLNSEEKSSLLNLCYKYNDIFHLEGDELTFTNAVHHEIPTTSNIPISTKTYRYPEVHKAEVNKQIEQMLKQGVIRPSVSPWSSPLWVVPKKLDASGNTKWRVVIDYRKLNNVTVGDAYPLPNINDILDQLSHSTYFTTLDLASGFHQIPNKSEDCPKTAFSTPLGHYEYTRMPFGLKMHLLHSKDL